MTATLSSSNPAKLNSFLETIAQVLGVDITLLEGNFKMELQGIGEGSEVYCVLRPGAGGPSQVERLIKTAAMVIPETDALDADTVAGTTTLVASTKDVTITGGVPVGSTVIATHTTPAGVAKYLTAVRQSATAIRISSAGDGYAALLESAGASAALVAGTKDIALANVAGDLLAVKQTAAGGTPLDTWDVIRKDDTEVTVTARKNRVLGTGALVAGVKTDIALVNAVGDALSVRETAAGGAAADHFSVVRTNGATVKVQAHNAAGALVAGNTSTVEVIDHGPAVSADTSTVKVFNFGAKGHDTSLVRYIVSRP